MNAAEIAFREIEKERKSIARGSRNKINGSRSKRCSLPSDHLTKKEWCERNGNLMSYNLNSVIKWADFMEMPRDLQKEYLKKCYEHNARSADLVEMMGTSAANFSHYIANHIPEVKTYKKVKTRKVPDKEWEEYLKTLKGEKAESVVEEPTEIVEEPEAITEKKPVNKVPIETSAQSGDLTYCGKGMSILMNIAKVINPDRLYSVNIHFADIDVKEVIG